MEKALRELRKVARINGQKEQGQKLSLEVRRVFSFSSLSFLKEEESWRLVLMPQPFSPLRGILVGELDGTGPSPDLLLCPS